MAKMWAGVTDGKTNRIADGFNSSISFDSRMWREDIHASMAHASMLAGAGILTAADCEAILTGLEGIEKDLESGALSFDTEAEDIHMFVEETLTKRIGAAGKKLHTARSRNDQVAQDLRLTLRKEVGEITDLLKALIEAVLAQAEAEKDTILPGYTHLQRAQPILFAQHLLAYCFMFLRDTERLADAAKRMNLSPIGSCALAGTTFPTDRAAEAAALGFDGVTENSIDGVSDRDFCVELLSALSLIMAHLSRFSEEIVLWSSAEFSFVHLSDAFTTGSSIMPQKKNPDMAELCRGKTGRVYGDLVAMLTVLKGLPLAYNKDMQEDKEAVFDAVDTVKACLSVFAPMIASMQADREAMKRAAAKGFINATDAADYLAKKGVPFREAYQCVGAVVAKCMTEGKTLEELSLEEYKAFHPAFGEDLYAEIDLANCVKKRISEGGTGPDSVKKQIRTVQEKLK